MTDILNQLVAEGYFHKVAQGDTRAASLFARLVAYRLNPNGDPSLPGWLKKGGGHNVDGYAEDAIVLNGNPADRHNVIDLVSGAGAPGASPVWNGPLPRREHDVWEAPRPLSPADLAYLKGAARPIDPIGPPASPCKFAPDAEAKADLASIKSALSVAINELVALRRDANILHQQLANVHQIAGEAKDAANHANLTAKDVRAALQNGLNIEGYANGKPLHAVAKG